MCSSKCPEILGHLDVRLNILVFQDVNMYFLGCLDAQKMLKLARFYEWIELIAGQCYELAREGKRATSLPGGSAGNNWRRSANAVKERSALQYRMGSGTNCNTSVIEYNRS